MFPRRFKAVLDPPFLQENDQTVRKFLFSESCMHFAAFRPPPAFSLPAVFLAGAGGGGGVGVRGAADGGGALLARHAHLVHRHRPPAAGAQLLGRAARRAARWHRLRRPQGAPLAQFQRAFPTTPPCRGSIPGTRCLPASSPAPPRHAPGNIQAQLSHHAPLPGPSSWGALRAALPAGTVSSVPKARIVRKCFWSTMSDFGAVPFGVVGTEELAIWRTLPQENLTLCANTLSMQDHTLLQGCIVSCAIFCNVKSCL